jgi:type IV pilus assembly protein PilB
LEATGIEQRLPAPAAAGGIGRALVEARVLTPKQLAYAERVHAKLGVERPLLDLLRELFAISDAQVRSALRQTHEPLRLGDLLVELGYLRTEFLDLALAIQRQDPTQCQRIGQVLLEHQLIDERELVEALALHLGFALEVPGTEPIAAELVEAISLEECDRHCMVPIRATPNGVVVAFSDPTDPESIAAAESAFGAERVVPAIAERAAIRSAIARAAGRDEPAACGTTPPPAIVDLLAEVLEEALEIGASSVHLEPRADGIAVRLREGGVLSPQRTLPLSLALALGHHLRFLCRTLDGPESHAGCARFVHQHAGGAVTIAMSSCPVAGGERIVLRLADVSDRASDLGAIGLTPSTLAKLRSEIDARAGRLWLVAGPPASGRSTTFRALLRALAGPDIALSTLECVPTRRIEGAAQFYFERDAGAPDLFASALRQDPDVLGIDELSGEESARLALAAVAGRRVIAVAAGDDARGAAIRLASLGLDRPLFASVLGGVVAQKILRRACPYCAKEDGSRSARQLEDALGVRAGSFRAGLGCAECRNTGHRGNVAVFELWVPDAHQRCLLARGCTEDELRRAPEAAVDVTLFEEAVTQCARGVLSAAEVLRVFGPPEEARTLSEILERTGG